MPIPPEVRGQSYIDLGTYRKSGDLVHTPVWFGDENDRLYVMTRSDSGKYKRIQNNSQIRIAPCTIRGRITGPEFSATARILPQTDWQGARAAVHKKYWLARIPFLWSKTNVYLEISVP